MVNAAGVIIGELEIMTILKDITRTRPSLTVLDHYDSYLNRIGRMPIV